MVSWLIGDQPVTLDGWLVVRLSAWLVGWWSSCQLAGVVAFWVVELSAFRESVCQFSGLQVGGRAVSLDGRLVVGLSAWMVGWCS